MNDIAQTMNSQDIFNQHSNHNQWPIIQNMLTARTVIATDVNDVRGLDDTLNEVMRGPEEWAFSNINKFYQFDLYKNSRKKIIFNKITGRVVPDKKVDTSAFCTEAEFCIPPDYCNVANLTYLYTTHFAVKDYRSTEGHIIVPNPGSDDMSDGIKVNHKDILSLKCAYPKNFILNHADMFYFGVKTNGSSDVQIQQKFPVEMAYIAFNITCDTGYGTTYARWLRNDVYILSQDPYDQYNKYEYQVTHDQDGNPWIAKYCSEDTIEDMFFNRGAGAQDAKIDYVVQEPPIFNNLQENMKYAFAAQIRYNLGSEDSTLEFTIGADKNNERFYTKTKDGKYVSVGTNNKYELVDEPGAIAPLIQCVDGKFIVGGSILHSNKTHFKLTKASGPSIITTNNTADNTISVKFNTKSVPVFITTSMNSSQHIQQLQDIYERHKQIIPSFKLTVTDVVIASGEEQDDEDFTSLESVETLALIPTVSIQAGSDKHMAVQWNVINIVESLDEDGKVWKYPATSNVTIKVVPTNQDGGVHYFRYDLNSFKGGIQNDPTGHCCAFIKGKDESHTITQILSACNVYTVDNNRQIQHMDKTQFKRSYQVGETTGYDNVTGGEGSIYRVLETNTPFSGGIVEQAKYRKQWMINNVTQATNQDMLPHLKQLLVGISEHVSKAFGNNPLDGMTENGSQNIVVNSYNKNDFLLGSLYHHIISKGRKKGDDRKSDKEVLDLLRYNAAQLYQQDNADKHPSIQNVDYVSVRTFKEDHGVVDWYIGLPFAFFTEGGLEYSFPMSATQAQNLVFKVVFCDPRPLMQTELIVKPEAVGDYSGTKKGRVFINQLINSNVLVSNMANMKHVLFYNKYVFDSRLQDVIANSTTHSWVLKSYERTAAVIVSNKQGGELTRLTRSVNYTKTFLFFVTTDTIEYINHRGRVISDKQQLYVDRYSKPIWDILSYDVKRQSKLAGYGGQNPANHLIQANTARQLVPVESIGVTAGDSRTAMEYQPFRFLMLNEYLNAPHEKGTFHQPMLMNNMVQINIDPKFWQIEMAQAYYAAGNSPKYIIKYKPKLVGGLGDNEFGLISVEEYVNVSEICDGYCASRWKASD